MSLLDVRNVVTFAVVAVVAAVVAAVVTVAVVAVVVVAVVVAVVAAAVVTLSLLTFHSYIFIPSACLLRSILLLCRFHFANVHT